MRGLWRGSGATSSDVGGPGAALDGCPWRATKPWAKVAAEVQPVGTSPARASSAPSRTPDRARRRPGSRKDALRRRLLFTADLLTFLLAVAAMTVSEGTTDPLWALLMLPLWLLIAKVEGLYDADHPKIWHLTSDEAAAIFHWITLSVAATLFFIRALPDETITVETAFALYATALASAFLLRTAARAIWRRRVPPERALVLGEGKLADAVARKLTLEPGHHLTVLELSAHGSSGNGNGDRRRANGAFRGMLNPEELTKEDLEYLLSETDIERVILAVPELDEDTLARVVSACRSTGVKLSVLPPMRAMLGTAVQLTHIAEMPVIEYGTWGTSPSTVALKRGIDILVSAAGIVVLTPLMLLIAIAVRVDSRGPAFFKQLRAGRHGKPFRIVKFRTMCHDAEERVSEVISVDDLTEPMFKLKEDPRVTRVGRFLRRTSLDELPQLFNVLRGDMSLVGPRPEEVWLVERYGETQRFRLQMRPGLTGPMQVHGRGELNFQERLAVEREYVENYSLRKDLKIVLRTGSAIFRANGAY
jgi:exopolysaccharide biosynthesis polyprenyl glycosylphosphotransferase